MTSKTIPLYDQYNIDGINYFKVLIIGGGTLYSKNGSRKINKTFRDIYVDIPKNQVSVLKELAKFLEMKKYSKLKKQELVDNILSLLIFE